MTKRIYYIGSLPPPYGGVTVKNKLLIDELANYFIIRYKNTNNGLVYMIKAILFGNSFILGVGSTSKLIKLTKILSLIVPWKMKKSIVFVMGGSMADYIGEKNKDALNFCKYKKLFVETNEMLIKLKNIGITNVSYFPNCRKSPQVKLYPKNNKGQLKCVFFAQITPEKGVDLVLEAAKKLCNIQFDFYGHIKDGYENDFMNEIGHIPNAKYCGVFQQNGESVYMLLNLYDILLFPTKWKNEGVPGVLVESKISCLPSIVSDICYNREIINDEKDGIVLKDNNIERLCEEITKLDINRNKLLLLKKGAQQSAKQYDINLYISKIVEQF